MVEWVQSDRLEIGREEDETTEVDEILYILVSAAIPIHILCNENIPREFDTVVLHICRTHSVDSTFANDCITFVNLFRVQYSWSCPRHEVG